MTDLAFLVRKRLLSEIICLQKPQPISQRVPNAAGDGNICKSQHELGRKGIIQNSEMNKKYRHYIKDVQSCCSCAKNKSTRKFTDCTKKDIAIFLLTQYTIHARIGNKHRVSIKSLSTTKGCLSIFQKSHEQIS